MPRRRSLSKEKAYSIGDSSIQWYNKNVCPVIAVLFRAYILCWLVYTSRPFFALFGAVYYLQAEYRYR